MNIDKPEGAAQNAAGKVQSAAGDVLGDASTQIAGGIRQARGKVQETFGDVVGCMTSMTESNPLGMLAVAAAAGFLLGALFTTRRD
jgi:uncharacterized protein YjbJ (UPF0337 family)